MGLKDCQIFLDNPWHSYYSGQTVNGRVEYTLDAPKKIRGVSVNFKGFAKTSWYETHFGKGDGQISPISVNYLGDEEYFSTSYYLIGSRAGKEMILPEGKHVYPITCTLPANLPSSFEGEFGHIRYTVKVTLDRPWKFDQDTKMAFTVVPIFDLNLNPDYNKPFSLHLEKRFCCLWCKTGPLVIDIGLPVTGFCSGQTMPFEINCENGSDVNLSNMILYFSKVVIYRAQMPFKEKWKREVVIAQVALGSLAANSSKTWREVIPIPPLPPSNLMNCKIIDLDYEVKMCCETSGARKNIKIKGNVVLGTIPLVGFQPYPAGDILENSSADQVNAVSPLLPQEGAQNVKIDVSSVTSASGQPIFQESQFSTSCIRDKGDNKNMRISGDSKFAPKYPTYSYGSP